MISLIYWQRSHLIQIMGGALAWPVYKESPLPFKFKTPGQKYLKIKQECETYLLASTKQKQYLKIKTKLSRNKTTKNDPMPIHSDFDTIATPHRHFQHFLNICTSHQITTSAVYLCDEECESENCFLCLKGVISLHPAYIAVICFSGLK